MPVQTAVKCWLSLAALIILIMGGMFVPVRAQDGGGLSEEEMALVQRGIEAQDAYDTFSSVVEDSIFARTQGATIRLGEQYRIIETASNWLRHTSIINEPDGRNISATITADIENSQTTAEGKTVTSALSLSIESRVVDGTLYVMATYPDTVSGSDDLPPLPEGWTEVASVDDWPVLRGVGLEDLLEDNSIMDDPDLFKSAVSAARVESTTLDDGTPAEIITFEISAEGIKALYLDQLDPEEPAAQLIASSNEESGAVLELTIGADNTPYRAVSTIILRMTDIDPALIGANQLPEGATVDFALDSVQDESYSQINEPLEPATVPEE